jgi:Domain of unknown function (DUF222)/HNH endonuclease
MPTHDQQDPSRLSAEELCDEICTLAGQIAAATCRWLLLLAEWDRRSEWSDGETKTCADWLSWRCSIMPVTAREHLRIARRLGELPRITAAFASGVLSYSKVRAITRVAEPATEEQLLMLAEHATGATLERLVRGYRRAASACLETANDAHRRRYLRWEWAEDGSLRFRGRLPAEDGALLLAALNRAERELERDAPPPQSPPSQSPPPQSPPSQSIPTPAHAGDLETFVVPPTPEGEDTDTATRYRNRGADALVTVVRTALAAEPDGRRADADPCEVMVHVDAATLAADAVADRTDLEDGPSLAPETVRRLACDASVVRIVERDGRPLTAGRRTRTIPPALRRALRSRDGCCRFPGCSHSRFLHAHHVRHWAQGGPTDIANLVMLCSHHHRLVHEGGYTIELYDAHSGPDPADPRRSSRRARRTGKRSSTAISPSLGSPSLRFRRPDGSTVPDHPDPGPLRGLTVADQARRAGARIDASTCQARSAGGRCDHGIAVNGLLERVTEARARAQAGIPDVRSPDSALNSGPSERRSVSGGDRAEIDSSVWVSDGDTSRPVWASD